MKNKETELSLENSQNMMDYQKFKDEIFKLTGIMLDYYKEKQMKRRIDSLIQKNKFSNYYDYIQALKEKGNLFQEFIDYITINVSEFYRNPEQWEVLEKYILPGLIKTSPKLNIWSAACSTGDEPYTLVMVLNKYLSLDKIKILATDIDKKALSRAEEGIYGFKSLEKLPNGFINKYFIEEKDLYKIKNEVKNCVNFKNHDLLKHEYPEKCDLIICRNVLIYFTEEAKNLIYTKFNKALKIGGVLFVGSTEQIIMSAKFGFKAKKTFFYVKEKEIEH